MRNMWTIARREYSRYFTSPVAYVVAFVILLTLGIMFALTILVYSQNAFSAQGPATAPDMSGITGTFTFLLVLSKDEMEAARERLRGSLMGGSVEMRSARHDYHEM